MTSAYICNIAAGMSFGHSAVLLPELQRANSSVTVDENISSWIGKYVLSLSTAQQDKGQWLSGL
jgi:hypothetical protein